MNFSEKLINWYQSNKRDLEWRKTKDPYKIWLSEIIMQQTRIEQGTAYYLKFIHTYPTVEDLAQATEENILKLWQGLGYYSRARNLHQTAKNIVTQYQSQFPNDYNKLLKLKGIGEYTAAAIASFAFDLPYVSIDGNVQRFLSRMFGLHAPINTSEGKKEIQLIADKLLPKNHAATFNQALMDFGSILCKAQSPLCKQCPFAQNCYALANEKVNLLPIKKKAAPKQDRFMYYFLFFYKKENKTHLFINLRNEKDIWHKLYDFPLIENDKELTMNQINNQLSLLLQTTLEISPLPFGKKYKHILSHRILNVQFFSMQIHNYTENFEKILSQKYKSIAFEQLQQFPYPQLIINFFADYLNSNFRV